MAKHPIHFFTEHTLLDVQNSNDSFGPLVGLSNKYKQFQITSKHSATTASENPLAFAVTKGQIFVQQDANDATLLNIALKPKDQHLINGYAVRFFIYRGIAKSSLISGTNIIANSITVADRIDLVKNIWKAQDKINNLSSPATSNVPSQNILGLGFTNAATDSFYTTSNSDYLEKFFYIKDDTNPTHNFHSWDINLGDSIGRFNKNSFGFEIIVGNTQPTVGDLRNTETRIQASDDYTALPDNASKFTDRNTREKVLNYLDPCAFYGIFYEQGVKTNTGKLKKDDLVTMLRSKFFNRNKIYLDLRNRHNQSFNFYSFPLKPVNISVNNVNYTLHISYSDFCWPLIIIDTSSIGLPVDQTSIKINFSGVPVSEIAFHLAQGYYAEDFPKIKKKLIAKATISSNINIDLASFTSNISGTNYIVPTIIKARHLNTVATNANLSIGDFELESETYIDNLFKLNDIYDTSGNMIFPFNPTKPCCWRMLDEEVYVDEAGGFVGGYIGKIGYAKDATAFYFFGFSSGDELRKSSIDPYLLSGESDSTDFINDILRTNFNSFNVQKDQLSTIPVIVSTTDDLEKTVLFSNKKIKPSNNNFFYLVITNNKIADFKNKLTQFYFLTARLSIKNDTPTSVTYSKADLSLSGHTPNSDKLKQNIKVTNTSFVKSDSVFTNAVYQERVLYDDESSLGLTTRGSEAQSLFDRLKSIYNDNKTVFGHQETFCSGRSFGWRTNNDYKGVVIFPNKIGWRIETNTVSKQNPTVVYGENYSDIQLSTIPDNNGMGYMPGIFGWDIGWLEKPEIRGAGTPVLINETRIDNLKNWISKVHSSGGINSITWHCKNPYNNLFFDDKSFYNDLHSTGNSNIVSKIISYKSEFNKAGTEEVYKVFDRWLKTLADFFKSLKSSDGKLIPIIFRPLHEPNAFAGKNPFDSGGFWWDARYCQPSDIKALYKYIHTALTKTHNVTNVVFAFSMNDDFSPTDINNYCPDDVVDILGLDIYQRYSTNNYFDDAAFKNRLKSNYIKIYNHAQQNSQIAAITEVGCNKFRGQNNWFQTVFEDAITQIKNSNGNPKILYTLFWRNEAYSGLDISEGNRDLDLYVPYFGMDITTRNNFKLFIRRIIANSGFLFLGDSLKSYKTLLIIFLTAFLFSKSGASQDYLKYVPFNSIYEDNSKMIKIAKSEKYPIVYDVYSDRYLIVGNEDEIAVLSLDSLKVLFQYNIFRENYAKKLYKVGFDLTSQFVFIERQLSYLEVWDWKKNVKINTYDPMLRNMLEATSGSIKNPYHLSIDNIGDRVLQLYNAAGTIDILDLNYNRWLTSYIKDKQLSNDFESNKQKYLASEVFYEPLNKILVCNNHNQGDSLFILNLENYNFSTILLGDNVTGNNFFLPQNSTKGLFTILKNDNIDKDYYYLYIYYVSETGLELKNKIKIATKSEIISEGEIDLLGNNFLIKLKSQGWCLFNITNNTNKIIKNSMNYDFLSYTKTGSLVFFNPIEKNIIEWNTKNKKKSVIKKDVQILDKNKVLSSVLLRNNDKSIDFYNTFILKTTYNFRPDGTQFFFSRDKESLIFISSHNRLKKKPFSVNLFLEKIVNLKNNKQIYL